MENLIEEWHAVTEGTRKLFNSLASTLYSRISILNDLHRDFHKWVLATLGMSLRNT